jgi:hypothetical protein
VKDLQSQQNPKRTFVVLRHPVLPLLQVSRYPSLQICQIYTYVYFLFHGRPYYWGRGTSGSMHLKEEILSALTGTVHNPAPELILNSSKPYFDRQLHPKVNKTKKNF